MSTPFARLDDIPVYEIDGMTWPATVLRRDELGREWIIPAGGDKGFMTPAAPRAARVDRPNGHGSYRGVAFRQAKTRSLAGTVYVPRGLRDQTEQELAGLCGDPARLYPLRRRTEFSDLTVFVELDGDPEWAWTTINRLDFTFQFVAPDPRKHSTAWQDPIVNTPSVDLTGNAFAGLDFAAPGLGYDLDFGVAGTSPLLQDGFAQVANYGTAPAYPLFKLTGALSRPTIYQVETGRTISYGADLAAGEVLTINSDEFPQRNSLPHARISSRRGNVGSLCNVATEWPVVNPGTTAKFQLKATGSPTAELMVSLRSAWW